MSKTNKVAQQNYKATQAGGLRTGNKTIEHAPVTIWYGPNAPLQDERLRTNPLPASVGHAKLTD